MVEAAEFARALDRRDVFGILDDADDAEGAPRVATDAAPLLLGHVPADLAEAHLVAHLRQQLREVGDVETGRLQDVERDALCRLRPDAGEASELVDQVLDDAVVHQANLVGAS